MTTHSTSYPDPKHPNTTVIDNTPKSFGCVDDVRQWIKQTALSLGFADCGFLSPFDPVFKQKTQELAQWLEQGYQGGLDFLKENHPLRANPHLLVTGTQTIISVRMDYLSVAPTPRHIDDNARPNHAIIARYARGRDYHKTMRAGLKKLAQAIQSMLPSWRHLDIGADTEFVFRPFSDSAPIFERAVADHAGLGWTGKHTLLIHRHAGSFFVLGELFISLKLGNDTPSQPTKSHCGSCHACLDICPTQAIVTPFTVNAGACISYLTIEHSGSIPIQYRRAIGNRVFGCDDCQLICPWNRYAKLACVPDFAPRHGLDEMTLLSLWQWDEHEFLEKTAGSPLRRAGFVNILRNTAVALGNALHQSTDPHEQHAIITALYSRLGQHEMLDEHITWAINQAK